MSLYRSLRKLMKPGDVIAFSGKSNFSNLIKFATRSPVSHVAVVVQSKLVLGDQVQDGFLNQIIESDEEGVVVGRLSDRIEKYRGDVWWCPLHPDVDARMDKKKFFNFLLGQVGKSYDWAQAVGAGSFWDNSEDFNRFFCSELIAAAFEAAGALKNVNASEVTPADLCMFKLYGPSAAPITLKGNPGLIRGYNSLDPTGWGQ